MTTMLDAIRRTHPHLVAHSPLRGHPHLLTPRPMCEHCGVRRARAGVLCATCDDDPVERTAFLARQDDAVNPKETPGRDSR